MDRVKMQIGKIEEQLQERKERGEGDSPESREMAEQLRGLREKARASEDMPVPARRQVMMGGGPRTPEEPARRTEVRVFHLQQSDPERVRDALQPVVGRSGQITVDERTRSVIVNTTPENHARAEDVVRQLDAPAGNRNLGAEVEDLRIQMKEMHEQMQQMRKLLEQTVERGRMEKPAQK
jgi:type II secretory pathway component GspD/PulD (secretin)